MPPETAAPEITPPEIIYVDSDKIGCVFGDVSVVGENRGHRFADIADILSRERRLAIGLQGFGGGIAKIDRRQVANFGTRPHGDDAFKCKRRRDIDRDDRSMRVLRAHHPHVKLVWKGDVVGEASASAKQRLVLQPRQGTAEITALAACVWVALRSHGTLLMD